MIDYDEKSWISVALQLRGSVIPRILPRVLFVTAVGAGAQYLNVVAAARVPPVLHTLLGVALGLLLVFRTTASYDRWWEGRKLLGGLLNRTRDIARQARGFLTKEDERDDVQRYASAYFVLACQGLRRENDLEALSKLLTTEERATLASSRHRANVVSAWMTELLGGIASEGRLTEQLFGVDEIGVEIEDPFGHDLNDLPLEAVAATIEGDTRELVRSPERPVRAPSGTQPPG